jgi:hypothetical protein
VYDASAYDTICSGTGSFPLTGGFPAGGNYSGPGVSGNVFNPASAGQGVHTITYTYTDSAGCTGTATQQVVVDVCMDVASVANSTGMTVYPNPASADFTIEFVSAGTAPEATLTIVNSLGQIVEAKQMNCTAGVNRWQIDAADFAAGMYFINITAGTETFSQRLEIQ